MKRNNKQLIISAIIVIVSLIVIDTIVGVVGDYAMRRMPNFSGQLAKDNYRLNRVTTDVIIVGSSRGHHHYVATMLKDSINHYTKGEYSLYNGAIAGKAINSNSCAAESIMERYSPKLLIFEVTENEFVGTKAKEDMEFAAVNYYNNHFVKEYVDNLGWKERVIIKSNLYRLNRKLFRIASSYFTKGEETGYLPLYGIMKNVPEQIESEERSDRVIDEYSLNNFSRVLRTAKEKGIMLVVATSPRFLPTDNNSFLSELCKQYDTPYIDLYRDSRKLLKTL